MNIKVPDSHGLQRKLNILSDKMVDLNEQQMERNQQYVHHINRIAERIDDEAVDTEYDVSYASRPQAGCEATTPNFAPLIEINTQKKLVISLQVGNKLQKN
ncbi:hypothetical protein CHS0354_001541 [Potamilus streckersoni]|uniref:Mutator-like transposase domain-containing protein n=1 Tax=Potamilus streckersoni TaxID=2493646 RepID=A0AAE0SMR3_9BIVA|nr:hypothetical protein CHS0354_001541 [Potamilus streckersoni]